MPCYNEQLFPVATNIVIRWQHIVVLISRSKSLLLLAYFWHFSNLTK